MLIFIVVFLGLLHLSHGLLWAIEPLRQLSANPRNLFLTSTYAWQYLKSLGTGQPLIVNPEKAGLESQYKNTSPLVSSFINSGKDMHTMKNIPASRMPSRSKHHSSTEMKANSNSHTHHSGWPHIPSPFSGAKHQQEHRDDLKRRLFAVCAGCDRGFAAVPVDREEIERLIHDLHEVNPSPNATKNFFPRISPAANEQHEVTPLEGAWKMIYTSAYDVCALASNPLTIVQGVYQVIARDGAVVNVIDIAPRPQALLPPSILGEGTTLRLKIHVKATAKTDTRIGLTYRRVEMKPLKLLSRDVDAFVPPISAPLPNFIFEEAGKWLMKKPKKLLWSKQSQSQPPEEMQEKINQELRETSSSSFYDVLYLDEDTLIIKHGEHGGYFVSVRSSEPTHAF